MVISRRSWQTNDNGLVPVAVCGDMDKRLVCSKDKPEKIGSVRLAARRRGTAPQASGYAPIKKLRKAKTMSEVFSGV